MLNREIALESLKENVENENLIKHMLSVEAIMRALARRLGQDENLWGITGLLHDIDVELSGGDMTIHSQLGADMLTEMGLRYEAVQAVLRHNEAHGIPVETPIDIALFCSDALSGLVTTTALVRPDKKLGSVELKSIRKKYREKGFAAGVKREQIEECCKLDLELDEFIQLGLDAMKEISEALGL